MNPQGQVYPGTKTPFWGQTQIGGLGSDPNRWCGVRPRGEGLGSDPGHTGAVDMTTAVGLLVLALVVGTYGTIIGAGGGFVLIPALVLLFDLEGVEAVGTGAVALTVIGVTGALAHDKGGLVERETAMWFGLAAVPVALACGWFVAGRIDSDAFTGVLAVLLLVLAAFVVFGPGMEQTAGDPLPARRRPLALAGAVVGAVSGTFAVGGGLITRAHAQQVAKPWSAPRRCHHPSDRHGHQCGRCDRPHLCRQRRVGPRGAACDWRLRRLDPRRQRVRPVGT